MELVSQSELKTGEQRFGAVAMMFSEKAKKKYHAAERLNDMPESMKKWVVNKQDIIVKFHLNSTFSVHLKNGRLMSLTEYVKFFFFIFNCLETAEDRLMAWLNAGTLLFYNTLECEDFDFHPFDRPLDQLLNRVVEERVKKRLRQELRIKRMEWENERRQEEQESRNKR